MSRPTSLSFSLSLSSTVSASSGCSLKARVMIREGNSDPENTSRQNIISLEIRTNVPHAKNYMRPRSPFRERSKKAFSVFHENDYFLARNLLYSFGSKTSTVIHRIQKHDQKTTYIHTCLQMCTSYMRVQLDNSTGQTIAFFVQAQGETAATPRSAEEEGGYRYSSSTRATVYSPPVGVVYPLNDQHATLAEICCFMWKIGGNFFAVFSADNFGNRLFRLVPRYGVKA